MSRRTRSNRIVDSAGGNTKNLTIVILNREAKEDRKIKLSREKGAPELLAQGIACPIQAEGFKHFQPLDDDLDGKDKFKVFQNLLGLHAAYSF